MRLYVFSAALRLDGDAVVFDNQVGFGFDFNGFTLPFSRFRLSGVLAESGSADGPLDVFAQAICGEIDFYGTFLRQLGFCNPDSDILAAAGAVELDLAAAAEVPPDGVGTPTFGLLPGDATGTIYVDLSDSTLNAADHNLGVLAVDAAGHPLPCAYTEGTFVETADGHPTRVGVACPMDVTPARAWLMVDTSAVAEGTF